MAYFDFLIPELLGQASEGLSFDELRDRARVEFDKSGLQEDTYVFGFNEGHFKLYLGVFDGKVNPGSEMPRTHNHGKIEYRGGRFFLANSVL